VLVVEVTRSSYEGGGALASRLPATLHETGAEAEARELTDDDG
jgi:hypothetical protein